MTKVIDFPSSAMERFWSCVDKKDDDSCWVWTKNKTDSGYGVFSYLGVTYRSHRVSLTIKLGRQIQDGLCACHTCHNRACVNPNHLYEGTHQENMHDEVLAGRSASGDRNASRLYPERRPRGDKHWTRISPEKRYHPYGELNGQTHLTSEDVRQIRSLYGSGEYTYTEISKMFDVLPGAIGKIVRYERWANV